MSDTRMKIVPKSHAVPSPRGRMMNAAQISDEKYFGHRDAEWVRENVPHRMKFGHRTVLWYEQDVDAFIESVREKGAA